MVNPTKKSVAVIGGGLAGVAAAIRLADAGYLPIVIESRKMLGGRATSVVDPRHGELIDNCQHVVLGCCTNLLDFYDRLGVLDRIQWHRTLYWSRGHGGVDRMKAAVLPAPVHLSPACLRMKLFDRAERRHIARVMWRIIRRGAAERVRWADRTFLEFLEDCGQPEPVIRRFWDVIITSACNLPVGKVGAAYALQVFQEGFLDNRWSYTMGLATVPLVSLYDPAVEMVRSGGGEVRLGTSARGIAYDSGRVTGVVTSHGLVPASAIVSAVPFDRLDKLASETMKRADTRLQSLNRLEFSTILGVHLWFGAPIMDLPHLILPDHGAQWLFNKGVDEGGRQHIHAVVSAADDWMSLNEDEIIARVLDDVHRALPQAAGLNPVLVRCIKEKRATFAATPGVEALRPAASPRRVAAAGIDNLFLAGDWCDTGWPATLEGAVRSGYAAANAVCERDGVPTTGLVEDVPASFLARLLRR